MSQTQKELQLLSSKAETYEQEYNWQLAADTYQQASKLASIQENHETLSRLSEKCGFARFRAAYQADSYDDFTSGMKLACLEYEKAADFYSKIDTPEAHLSGERCLSKALFFKSRMASDTRERRQLLNESLSHLGKTAEAFEEANHKRDYASCALDILDCLTDLMETEGDYKARERIAEEGVRTGDRALQVFDELHDSRNLAKAYVSSAYFNRHGAFAKNQTSEWREERKKNALLYLQKAVSMADESKDNRLIAESNCRLTDTKLDFEGSVGAEEIGSYQKALRNCEATKDHLMIGDSLWGLAFCKRMGMWIEEDPDRVLEIHGNLERIADEAINHYRRVGHMAGIAYTLAFHRVLPLLPPRLTMMPNIAEISGRWGIDAQNRQALLENAQKEAEYGLKLAKEFGSPGLIHHARGAYVVALYAKAHYMDDEHAKTALLQETTREAEEAIKLLLSISADALAEPAAQNLAVSYSLLGYLESEMAQISMDAAEKRRLLKQADEHMGKSWEMVDKYLSSRGAPDKFWVLRLGVIVEGQSKIQKELYSLTKDSVLAASSLTTTARAAKYYADGGAHSRAAECYWRMGETHDSSRDYPKAAEAFEKAAQHYRTASVNIPHLKEFFDDYSRYMEAWLRIENAKTEHERDNHHKESEHYAAAAELLKSTKSWSYLEANFSALAALEEAEDLSREEKMKEARRAFEHAKQLFETAESSIHHKLTEITVPEEKRRTGELAAAVSLRREYAASRAILEEARTADKDGDQVRAAEGYAAATEMFQRIASQLDTEQDRNDLEHMMYLARAWQRMAEAEMKLSPDLYGEAAGLFLKAGEKARKSRLDLLAKGNSHFCQALQSAASFKLTRDSNLYAKAQTSLDNAAQCYSKADYDKGASWTKATQRLFDAYVYMDSAEKDSDPDKRAKHYAMAEKVLDLAADLYEKAGFTGKRDEVLRALQSVKEEKELALSLTEVLRAPAIVTNTSTFTPPTPTREAPVGLEMFDQANVQSSLIVSRKEVHVGEDLPIELEMVNTGRASALLVKVEGLIPEGFEVSSKPEQFKVVETGLELSGKKLDPLKTVELKLQLKAKNKGAFSLKPKILFIDDKGKFRSQESEPIALTVKELGVAGWFRGPSK